MRAPRITRALMFLSAALSAGSAAQRISGCQRSAEPCRQSKTDGECVPGRAGYGLDAIPDAAHPWRLDYSPSTKGRRFYW
jgi:hypothetical protein